MALRFLEEVHYTFARVSEKMHMKFFSLAHYVEIIAALSAVLASWDDPTRFEFLKDCNKQIAQLNQQLEPYGLEIHNSRTRTERERNE